MGMLLVEATCHGDQEIQSLKYSVESRKTLNLSGIQNSLRDLNKMITSA